MTTKHALLAAAVLLSMGISASTGAPIQNPANGHYYELVLHYEYLTWVYALLEAQTKSFLGVPGYLATVTSEAENEFLAHNVLTERQYGSYYLGGYKNGHQWAWVTGEPWSYANWKPGEPWDGDYVSIIANPPPDAYGQWNDVDGLVEPGPLFVCHYVIEYPVPEPATLSLVALAGLPICRRRYGR